MSGRPLGLSDDQFCEENNYSIESFRYMQERLRAEQEKTLVPQQRSKFEIRSDAAKKRWVRDDKKETFWRRQIEAWKLSALSKRAFCKSKRLTESSFNAWIREIELRDREKVASVNASERLGNTKQKSSFVPLRLVETEQEPESHPTKDAIATLVSIAVPGGAVIRVSDCSASFVAELYSSLKV